MFRARYHPSSGVTELYKFRYGKVKYILILLHQAGVFQLSLYDARNHETEKVNRKMELRPHALCQPWTEGEQLES